MNILFSYIYLPHLSESGIFVDLIKEFAKQGHNVKVATPLVHGSVEGINIEDNIEVLRFKTDQLTRNSSNIKKGLAYIKYTYQILLAIRKYYKKEKFDLIIGHSLPPEFAIVVQFLKFKYRAKFYLMLCEYVWQDAISLEFFKENSIVCEYYKWLEKLLIKSADYIGSPSQGNIEFTLRYYPWVFKHNIHILHYSQYPIVNQSKEIDIRDKYSLKGKFLVIYGGNMTIAQKIENVIELAQSCLKFPDIVFLLLGRGPNIDKLKKDVSDRGISNIIFKDFLPKMDYNNLLSSCDIGLVSLNEKLGVPNIPSKTLSYFSLSIPIVASIDRITDYGLYLEIAGAGLWSYADDKEKFKENLLTLYHDSELRAKMGTNGYNFFIKNMLPENAYNTIINQINKLTPHEK